MLRNELKSRLKNGEIVYGTMVQEMTSPTVAQIFQRSGFDFIMIDCEHSPYDHSTVREILRVARLEKLNPLVRIRNLERRAFSSNRIQELPRDSKKDRGSVFD